MPHPIASSTFAVAVVALSLGAAPGCRYRQTTPCPTPAYTGVNTRDLIDPPAQKEAEDSTPADQLVVAAERLRKDRQQKLEGQSKKEGGAAATKPDRNVLCLSGGGSFGAYSAGVLVGWTERGDRPQFDVVTGISTGALIAPFAFLGPKYDHLLKAFYTSVENRDVYRIRPLWALFGQSFADNAPLAAKIDAMLTPEILRDLAAAHRQGRRLYVGTTEQEGKQFVVWDVGMMACRDAPGDRDLIAKVLLASTALPGLFPPTPIDVDVDGACRTERHVDGGVSQSLFFRPPYIPPDRRSDVAAKDLAGVKVHVIVAGKLYADLEVIRPRALLQAAKSTSALIYAQTRGDLQRLYTVCLLTGMDYFVSAIPAGYEAPVSSNEFDPPVLTGLFEEGRRVIASPTPWRTLPPGVGPGESVLDRNTTFLSHRARGPLLPISGPNGMKIPPRVPPAGTGDAAVVPSAAPGG